MNRKIRFSSTPWVAAALVAMVSAAAAQPAPAPSGGPAASPPGPEGMMMMHARHRGPGPMASGGRGMRGGMIEHLLANGEAINLTDAQRDKLRQIRRAAPAALMPKRQAVMEAQMDLHDALDNDKAASPDLRKAHDKVLKARNDLAAALFDLRVQVREVLTPEQRDKIHQHLRDAGGMRMKERMKRGPGGPGNGFFEGDEDDDDAGTGDGGEF